MARSSTTQKRGSSAAELRNLADSSVIIASATGEGSGTVIAHIGRNSYVLTCQHVVGNEKKATATYRSGKRFFTVSGKVERVNAEQDLAIVRLSRRVPVNAVDISDVEPELYERVWVVGAPAGRFGTAWEGILSGAEGSNQDPRGQYQLSVFTAPGASGGTVANFNGELIGVLTGLEHNGHSTVSGIVFAVPLPVVREFLKEGKVFAEKKAEGKK